MWILLSWFLFQHMNCDLFLLISRFLVIRTFTPQDLGPLGYMGSFCCTHKAVYKSTWDLSGDGKEEFLISFVWDFGSGL